MERLEQFKGFYQPFDYKCALGGRAAARSVSAAQAIVYFMDNVPGLKVVGLREFQNSISESSKAQTEDIIRLEGLSHRFKSTDTYIENIVTGAHKIFRGMARNPLSLKSLTGYHIAWIEECESMAMRSWDILDPTIRETDSQIWLTGNTYSPSCAPAQIFVENPPPPNSWVTHNTYLQNPFASQKLIDQANHMKANRPDMYRYVWLGKYLNESAMRMIQVYNLDMGIQIYDNWKTVIGVDIARSGGDKTVIAVRRGKKFLEIVKFDAMDLPTLVEELRTRIEKYKPELINVDSTGHGAWVPDALKSCGVDVEGINFSSASEDPGYSNKRTEIYGRANDYCKLGGTIPNDSDLIEELTASTWHPDSKNRQAMDPKDEIKKKIGRSPDMADAVALACYCAGDIIIKDSRIIQDSRQIEAMKRLMRAGTFKN